MFSMKIWLAYLELRNEIDPLDDNVIRDWEMVKRDLNNHIKLELGLEIIYQLTGQTILLAMAYSTTRTNEGLTTNCFRGSKSNHAQ